MFAQINSCHFNVVLPPLVFFVSEGETENSSAVQPFGKQEEFVYPPIINGVTLDGCKALFSVDVSLFHPNSDATNVLCSWEVSVSVEHRVSCPENEVRRCFFGVVGTLKPV